MHPKFFPSTSCCIFFAACARKPVDHRAIQFHPTRDGDAQAPDLVHGSTGPGKNPDYNWLPLMAIAGKPRAQNEITDQRGKPAIRRDVAEIRLLPFVVVSATLWSSSTATRCMPRFT